jgi:hypothetical protein
VPADRDATSSSCSITTNDLDPLVPYSGPRVWKCSSLKFFFRFKLPTIRYRLPKGFFGGGSALQYWTAFQGPAKEKVQNVSFHLMRWHVSVP